MLRYELVLKKIITDHQKMLEKLEHAENEKKSIQSSTKEVRKFFTYIQQQLFIINVYLLALCMKN